MKKKRVAILGSTGSIGRQALAVIAAHPDRLEIAGLVAGTNERELAAQAERFGVHRFALGGEAAVELAGDAQVDVVLNAIVGAAGLHASLAALRSGKTLALANKESLVAGGELCAAAAHDGGGRIVPVDSEHAALAQCLETADRDEIERVVITASGGPFRERRDLSGVTTQEALQHPTWAMGEKITIDSATLMNKGLEVIEAHHLFGLDYERIEVVVHPQSVVHAMVELRDGSVLMQAAATDMKLPIQAALLGGGRVGGPAARLDLASLPTLTFEDLDHGRFPAVRLAYETGRKGATFPAVLNAANEVAVHAFLEGALGFSEITPLVRRAVEAHRPGDASSLDDVLAADRWARETALAQTSLAGTTR